MITACRLRSLCRVTKRKADHKDLVYTSAANQLSYQNQRECHLILQQRSHLFNAHLPLFCFPVDKVSNSKSSEMVCRELIHLTFWNRQHPSYTAENLGPYLLYFWGLFCIHTTVAKINSAFCMSEFILC